MAGLALRFPLGSLELPHLIEMGFVAGGHAKDRRRHPPNQDRQVPTGLTRLGPGDCSEEENAGDRDEIAETLPVDTSLRDRAGFLTHGGGTTKPWRMFRFSNPAGR